MAMTEAEVLAAMDEEEKRASERPTGTFVPTFLRLKDKQKARVRPLFNLSQSIVLATHNKYNNADPKQSINAVCAQELGADCPHCTAAANDKKLTAGNVFYLPVYVSSVEQKNDNGTWIPVTYKKDDLEEPVAGLRILELKTFGSINQVYTSIRNLFKEDDNHDIRQYGLIIERSDVKRGDNQPPNPIYTILPKGPSAMSDAGKALVPTPEKVREMILAALPPAGVTVVPSSPKSSAVSERDNDF